MPVISSATVETLTAEVRVLMVGSRQVTLSVFRQLDWVDWEDCIPFGRVNDKSAEGEGRVVVGKHTDTGVLVRSQFYGASTWTRGDDEVCQRLAAEKKRILKDIEYYRNDALPRYLKDKAKYETIVNDESRSLSDRGGAERDIGYLRVPEDPTPKLASVESQLQEQDKWRERAAKNVFYNRREINRFSLLPLIVLAGLR